MPDADLRRTLEAARELMRTSKWETWRVQAELAAAEINRRATKELTTGEAEPGT